MIFTSVFLSFTPAKPVTAEKQNMKAGASDVEMKASETKSESSTDIGVSAKKLPVFKWKSINGDTIEVNLIDDIESEKSAIGLDIKF